MNILPVGFLMLVVVHTAPQASAMISVLMLVVVVVVFRVFQLNKCRY